MLKFLSLAVDCMHYYYYYLLINYISLYDCATCAPLTRGTFTKFTKKETKVFCKE